MEAMKKRGEFKRHQKDIGIFQNRNFIVPLFRDLKINERKDLNILLEFKAILT